MTLVLPTIADFKAQFVRDFPYATPLTYKSQVGATATAQIDNGAVTGITVTAPGSGYPSNYIPSVVIYAGNGMNAEAEATLTGGAVSAIAVTNPGFGYVASRIPYVYISLRGDNTDESKVTDFDLARAFRAAINFNISVQLFGSQAAYSYATNLLIAHYLVENLAAGGQGAFGRGEWLTESKTVGNVSETFSIPDRVLKSPILGKLSRTTYGSQFLELLSPQLIANFRVFHGITLP